MNSIKNIALSAFLTIGAFGAVTYTACNKDECKDVVCLNGGTCVGGTCTGCYVGFSGSRCEIESSDKRDKFVRTWSVTDITPSGSNLIYSMSVTKQSGGNIQFSESFADSFFVNKVFASVNGNAITIPNQEPDNDDYFVSGTGTYANGTVTIQYTLTPPAGSGDNPVTNNGTWE